MDASNQEQEREIHLSITLPASIHRKAKVLASIDNLSLGKYARKIIVNSIQNIDTEQINLKIPNS